MDMIVTTTGNVNVCDKHMLEAVKAGAIICNIGHFDNEIDTQYMRDNWAWEEVKPQVHKIYRGDGQDKDNYLILLSEGRLINLGNATGHPSRIMDGSFANQVLAQMFLYERRFAELEDSAKQDAITVTVLPKHLDEEVAALMVAGFGGVLTELTPPGRLYQCSGSRPVQERQPQVLSTDKADSGMDTTNASFSIEFYRRVLRRGIHAGCRARRTGGARPRILFGDLRRRLDRRHQQAGAEIRRLVRGGSAPPSPAPMNPTCVSCCKATMAPGSKGW